MNITHEILAEALGMSELSPFVADRISIDSRNIKPGDIFIAINRGHEFVNEAISSGASLAIIDDKQYAIPDKTLTVGNTTEALKNIGRCVKAKAGLKNLIALTGSVGKTTTKFWLHSLLNHKCNAFCSSGNYNTRYGVSLSLCQLEYGLDFGIFEIGSNHIGEIAELSEYLKPDIGVITNIFESHLGNFGDKQSLAREKISIVHGMKSGGVLIFDGDSEFAQNIQDEAGSKNLNTVAVGFSPNCDFAIVSYKNGCSKTTSIELKTPEGIVNYVLPFRERHLVYVSAMVLAVIWAMKLPIADFLPFMKNLSKIEGRGNVEKYVFHGKTIEIINDCYNASPESMKAAITSLMTISCSGRRIAVLGDMLELGAISKPAHRELGEIAFKFGVDLIYCYGDEAREIYEGALSCCEQNSAQKICHFKTKEDLIEKLESEVKSGDVVLFKASRRMRFEDIIEAVFNRI